MNIDVIQELANRGIKVALMISSPMLFGALFIGIAISIFQAVTQINEQTLSFIPKMMVIVGAMIIFAPWMTEILTNYTRELFLNIPQVLHQP